jgi:hypothetical protein
MTARGVLAAGRRADAGRRRTVRRRRKSAAMGPRVAGEIFKRRRTQLGLHRSLSTAWASSSSRSSRSLGGSPPRCISACALACAGASGAGLFRRALPPRRVFAGSRDAGAGELALRL